MLWKLKKRQQQWLAAEKGTILKDWRGRVRIALAFPNRYAVGMSNLGFQSVYAALNALDGVVCERVFYPEPEDIQALRRDPGKLLSVESQRPIADFHLVAFSLPFENDYVNVLEMLQSGGDSPQSQGPQGVRSPRGRWWGRCIFKSRAPCPLHGFHFCRGSRGASPGF